MTQYVSPESHEFALPRHEGPMPAFDYAGVGSEIRGVDNPAAHLNGLRHEGFHSEDHRQQLIGEIVSIGLPIDNYSSLHYRENEGDEADHLGSWGIGAETYGQFSIYELNDTQTPESRLGTLIHEGAHANTPLRIENAHLFGGEAERLEAQEYAHDLATQSLVTGKYLDGYHESLATQLRGNEITFDLFAEETQAIAVQLAMTNRARLAQTERAQHRQMDIHYPNATQVNILSQTDHRGDVTVDGIDKQLIALVQDVDDYQGLMGHVGQLKNKIYSEEAAAIANNRWNTQMPIDYQVRTAAYQHHMQQMAIEDARRRLNAEKDTDDQDESDD